MPVACVQIPPLPSGKVEEGEFSLLLHIPQARFSMCWERRGGDCTQATR